MPFDVGDAAAFCRLRDTATRWFVPKEAEQCQQIVAPLRPRGSHARKYQDTRVVSLAGHSVTKHITASQGLARTARGVSELIEPQPNERALRAKIVAANWIQTTEITPPPSAPAKY